MNKCPKCGTEFAGSFCPECGTMWQKERRCPRCGKSMPGSAKFCTYCGNAFFERPAQRRNESLEKFLQYFPAGLLLLFSLLLWAFYAAPVFKVDILIGSIEGNLYQIYGEEMLQELHATILALFVITAITCVCAILLLIFARKLSKPAYLLLTSVFYLFYIVLGSLLIVKIKGAELGAGTCPILILVFACVFAVASAVAVLLRKQAKRKKKSSAAAWIKRHKCLFGLSIAGAVAVIIVSIAVPVALANRYNGTYYLYEDEEYKYETYFILKGSTYTDETGYSCDAEFDGNHVTFYSELFGVKEKAAEGTIEKDVLKLNIMGTEVVYAKEGHKHEFENRVCTLCGWKDNSSEGLTYQEYGSDLTVTGIGSCKDTNIIIPRQHDGKFVTKIGSSAFQGLKELTSITIPGSVTSIGGSAFQGCSGLVSITIPDSVTEIGYEAFYNCSGLIEITIPDSVTEIGYDAFWGCSGLMEITIPDSVTWIGERAFQGCSGLVSVTIGSGVTSIGGNVFHGCSRLTDITIPDSVTSIGESAFRNCSGLTSITIPDSVIEIGNYAFDGCSELKEVHIADIAAWCNISFDRRAHAIDGDTSNPLSYAHHLYKDGDEITKLEIPNGVTSIGVIAFSGCRGLTEITIPDSVTSIGALAFSGCSGLASVKIGSGVKTIEEYAFKDCSKLTEIIIPDSVTSIGSSAFEGCSGLKNVHFENPNGWSTNGNLLSGLENSATAAKYLTDDYYLYSWERID